jgi:hypothetical protein
MALLQQHGSLEELLKHAADVKPKKAAASLSSGAHCCLVLIVTVDATLDR